MKSTTIEADSSITLRVYIEVEGKAYDVDLEYQAGFPRGIVKARFWDYELEVEEIVQVARLGLYGSPYEYGLLLPPFRVNEDDEPQRHVLPLSKEEHSMIKGWF